MFIIVTKNAHLNSKNSYYI